MGNDFKHLLNPDDAPPYRSFPRDPSHHHPLNSLLQPGLALGLPSPSSLPHPPPHGLRPLTEKTSAVPVPPRQDRSDSRPGPPASSAQLTPPNYQVSAAAAVSWTPVNRNSSPPTIVQIAGSTSRAPLPPPDLRLRPRQLSSASGTLPSSSTSDYFALPGTSHSSTIIGPGLGRRSPARPYSAGAQSKTPPSPSPSPSPVQGSERSRPSPRTYQDISTQTSFSSNQQSLYSPLRQERSVRFKEEPSESQSPSSTPGYVTTLGNQSTPAREIEHTPSDHSATYTSSPVSPQPLLSPESSTASLSQTTMSNHSGNAGASPPANEIYYNIIQQVGSPAANQQCQNCRTKIKASYDKLETDMSALIPREGQPVLDFDESFRRQEALLQLIRSHGKQMQCDECQQRKERGYQERDSGQSVGLNLLTTQQSVGLDILATIERAKVSSSTNDLGDGEASSQQRKRKMPLDTDHGDQQVASKVQKTAPEVSSPSPKCQTTPPSDTRQYHISSVNGHPVPRQPVSRNVGRLFEKKGKSRSDVGSAASPDIEEEPTQDMQVPKSPEKQRKDSGLVHVPDAVDASIQGEGKETNPS